MELIDTSQEIYQFTIIITFITTIIFFVAMYWYIISLEKSVREREKTRQSLKINSLELQSTQLQNQMLEAEKKAREEKNLRLEQAINLKNNELVSSTIILNQHGQVMEEIEHVISTIDVSGKKDKVKLSRLKKLLKMQGTMEAQWDNFRIQFEKIHPQFFARLNQDFPRLSENDIRHCAYMRMRMSTKEIAQLMGINPTSVQIARVRLKKKLDLDKDVDLRTYIINY